MAEGDEIPDSNHVARGVRPKFVDSNQVLPAAFALTLHDKGKLSADWVECAHANRREQTVEGSLARLANSLFMRPQRIAILNAMKIRSIERDGRQLNAIEDPHFPDWPCHSAIVGMAGDSLDLGLQQDLADLANRSNQVTLK